MAADDERAMLSFLVLLSTCSRAIDIDGRWRALYKVNGGAILYKQSCYDGEKAPNFFNPEKFWSPPQQARGGTRE